MQRRFLGGFVSLSSETIDKDVDSSREEFQSEFAKKLNFKAGHHFSYEDLQRLRAENTNLLRKINNSRNKKSKIDNLEVEIKLLRYQLELFWLLSKPVLLIFAPNKFYLPILKQKIK